MPSPVEELEARYQEGRAQHECLSTFNEYMKCMTPGRQLTSYYREGHHEDCPRFLFDWTDCLQGKVPAMQDRLNRRRDERARSLPGEHVWAFRAEYAEEAYRRYGVRLQRQPLSAGPLAALADTLGERVEGSVHTR